MEELREKFLKIYANMPISLREDIALVLPDKGTVTWNVAYFEVKVNSPFAQIILKGLNELKLI